MCRLEKRPPQPGRTSTDLASAQLPTVAAPGPDVGDSGTGTPAVRNTPWHRRLSKSTASSAGSSKSVAPPAEAARATSRTAAVKRVYHRAVPSTRVGSAGPRSSRSTSAFSPGESIRTISPGVNRAPSRSTSAQASRRGAGRPAARTASANSVTRRFSGLPTTAKRGRPPAAERATVEARVTAAVEAPVRAAGRARAVIYSVTAA